MPLTDNAVQLLHLLANGDFYSYAQLTTHLQGDALALQSALAELAALNLPLQISAQGVALTNALELLDAAQISAKLTPQSRALLPALLIFPCLNSTNTYLTERARQAATTGLACLAEYQSAGRGRRGRSWVSPFASNIYLSLLWRFSNSTAVAGLSLAVGVALVRALRAQGLPVGLKWPNDVLCAGKKLGGILIELSSEPNKSCSAIIGLGLNVAMPHEAGSAIEQAWTDVRSISERELSRNALVSAVLNELLPIVAEFEQRGIAAYVDEWRDYDQLHGKSATLFAYEQTFSGVLRGIDEQGLLLIETDDGNLRCFASGEVSFSK